jgi:hypothetical protein
MAGLPLDGPFVFIACDEEIARNTAKYFFEAGGSTAKPDAEIGVEGSGKGKIEFALKPLGVVRHEKIVDAPERFSEKVEAGTCSRRRTNWTSCRGSR